MNTSERPCPHPALCRRPVRLQRGAVLVEFGLVAFILYFLFAGILSMGRMMFVAQVVQDAARVAARELAVTPLPPLYTFEDALADPVVQYRVFDRDLLVVDRDQFTSEQDYLSFLDRMPPVNQALRPAMIWERVEVDGIRRQLLRYPGALLSNHRVGFDHPSGGFTVGIPQVVGRVQRGVEVIRWVPVMEEVRRNPDDPSTGPFSLVGTGPRGLVMVRLNYPFQSASLTAYEVDPDDLYAKNLSNPVFARDSQVIELNQPLPDTSTLSLQSDPESSNVYSGRYGLGTHLALTRRLRPYRKLITAQAIFRREVFQ